jgi:hypothetical protein
MRNLAERFAERWLREADDGDHYRLAFDQPGTWSTKYNLIWDGILGLGLFPPEVAAKETAWYQKVAAEYGTSLDVRNEFSKTDLALWAASVAPDKETFAALVQPVWNFLNQVPERNPITDLYWVKTGHEAAMHARPVMGGAFVRLIEDPALWAKWAGQGEKEFGHWGPFPKPRKWQSLVPTAEQEALLWRYTTETPADGWWEEDFDDSAWAEGKAGFGDPGTPGARVSTEWRTSDIWIRRVFDAPKPQEELALRMHHDEDAEVYLNGVLIGRLPSYTFDYENVALPESARQLLREEGNVLAIHCRQTAGGQYLDAGFVEWLKEAD